MKKKICFLIFSAVLLSACSVGRTTESRGLENEAYLFFVRGTVDNYSQGVDVYVDNNAPFKAKVNKVKAQKVKGQTYVVKSGKRHLKVVHRNQVLYEKDIIVSSQETKRIQLP